MVKYSRSAWFLGFVLLLAAAPVFAHHGAASVYDPSKKLTITGTVTKILWQNPHIGIFFDAADPATGKTLWHVNLGQFVTNAPMTYELYGRQYLLVAANDAWFAFALPE